MPARAESTVPIHRPVPGQAVRLRRSSGRPTMARSPSISVIAITVEGRTSRRNSCRPRTGPWCGTRSAAPRPSAAGPRDVRAPRGRAEWASQSDRGTSDEPGPSAYVPVQCSPEVFDADRPGRRGAAGRADRGAAGRRIDRREAGRRAPGTRRQDPRRVALRAHRHVDRAHLLLGDPWARDGLLRLDLPGLAPDHRVRLGVAAPTARAPPGRGRHIVGCAASPSG